MGAYNPKYTLQEETELVCREMIGSIVRHIESGDFTFLDFESDPTKYMDHRITHGDGWYHKIIISRIKKMFKVDYNKLEKEIRREEERWNLNCSSPVIYDPIPF